MKIQAFIAAICGAFIGAFVFRWLNAGLFDGQYADLLCWAAGAPIGALSAWILCDIQGFWRTSVKASAAAWAGFCEDLRKVRADRVSRPKPSALAMKAVWWQRISYLCASVTVSLYGAALFVWSAWPAEYKQYPLMDQLRVAGMVSGVLALLLLTALIVLLFSTTKNYPRDYASYTDDRLNDKIAEAKRILKYGNPVVAPIMLAYGIYKLARVVVVVLLVPILVFTYRHTVSSLRIAAALSAAVGVVWGYYLDHILFGALIAGGLFLVLRELPKIEPAPAGA